MSLSMRPLMATAVLLACGGAAAQQIPDGEPRVAKLEMVVRLQGDGRAEAEIVQELAVDTKQAVQQAGQLAIGYNDALEQVEVLDAYTQKPDGTREIVPTGAIARRDVSAVTNGPSLSEQKVLVVVFPEVAVGDRVHLKVRKRGLVPLFTGQFAALYLLGPHARTDRMAIEVHVPEPLSLRVDSQGFEASTVVEEGGRVYRFTASNPVAEPEEEGALSAVDYARHLAISTFASHADFAGAYAVRADGRAEPSDEVRKLASTVAEGEKDPRLVAQRLYAWVGKNVRYVAVTFGAGLVVPHPAGEVLANRYGDCKDQATLLQALLAARGIESTTALLNAQPSFWVARVPVLENFNHAIVYVPSLDLFLDPTVAERVAFGKLPYEEQGKTALLVHPGEFRTTPVDTAAENTSQRRIRYEVKGDGSIAAEVEIVARGRMADPWRAGRLATEDQRRAALRKLSTSGKVSGEGTLEVTASEDPATGTRVQARFLLTGGLEWPGTGAFEIPEGLLGPDSLGPQVIRGAGGWKRPHLAGAASVRQEYEIALPARMKVVAVPKDVHFENTIVAYAASYRLEGRTLRIIRQLTDRFTPPLLRPEQGKLVEEYSGVLARDLRAQVVYGEEGP